MTICGNKDNLSCYLFRGCHFFSVPLSECVLWLIGTSNFTKKVKWEIGKYCQLSILSVWTQQQGKQTGKSNSWQIRQKFSGHLSINQSIVKSHLRHLREHEQIVETQEGHRLFLSLIIWDRQNNLINHIMWCSVMHPASQKEYFSGIEAAFTNQWM